MYSLHVAVLLHSTHYMVLTTWYSLHAQVCYVPIQPKVRRYLASPNKFRYSGQRVGLSRKLITRDLQRLELAFVAFEAKYIYVW